MQIYKSMLFNLVDSSWLDGRDDMGYTAVHHAVCVGSLPIIKYLEKHAKVSYKVTTESERWTVLHLSAIHGHADLCKYFVDKRPALVNDLDRWGYTPLHYACDGGQTTVVCCLIQARADPYVTSTDNMPWTPENVAERTGHTDLVPVLQMSPKRKVSHAEPDNYSKIGHIILISCPFFSCTK